MSTSPPSSFDSHILIDVYKISHFDYMQFLYANFNKVFDKSVALCNEKTNDEQKNKPRKKTHHR